MILDLDAFEIRDRFYSVRLYSIPRAIFYETVML